MARLKFWSFAFALILCLCGSAFGQETGGSIEGTIRDPQGGAVPGVSVTITSRGRTAGARPDATSGFNRTVTTNDEGFFRVLEIPPGFYTITTAETAGFGTSTANDVEVVLGKTTPIDVTLQAAGVAAEVTVTDQVAIDPTDNKIQTNITSQIAELLPKGTNFTSLLQVAPAVRNEPTGGGFQIDGASGSENTFIIDGQEVTNFRTGALNTNNNLPFQLVQEVQVKSSGFEAEFGGATGGVINVVTKGGSNDFHGEFGITFRPSRLSAAPRPFLRTFTSTGQSFAEYINPRRDEGTDEFPTANLSGPILRDRLYFFGSYTPQFLNTNRAIDFVSGGTGAPSGRSITETQTFRSRQKNEYAFARLDATPTDNLRISGTYTWNPIAISGVLPTFASAFSAVPRADFGGSTGVLRGNELLGQQGGRVNSNNVTGSAVYTPTSNLVLSLRAGRSFLNQKASAYGFPTGTSLVCTSAAATNVPTSICPAGRATQNFAAAAITEFDVSTRKTLDADASYLLDNFGGRHQFKGGYQLNSISNNVSSFNNPTITLNFGTPIGSFAQRTITATPGAIGSGRLRRFAVRGEASSTNTALYIQDSWQPFNRLTLNLGLRAERENVPTFAENTESIQFGFGDKLAPRLGAAFDLTGDGRSKIFASYGRFYDRFKYELPRGSFGGDFYRDDYFELFPGGQVVTNYTTAQVLGNFNDPVTGSCPRTGFLGTGLTRCQIDRRVPSNLIGGDIFTTGGIDPDIQAFRQSEFTVGFERDMGAGFLLSTRYTHKQVDVAVEDIGVFNGESEAYIIGNPGRGLAAEVGASSGLTYVDAVRDYDAFEIRLDKRFTRRFYFNANYTLSRLFGNYGGLASSDEAQAVPGQGRQSPNVNRYFDAAFVGFTGLGQRDDGRLPTDRPHSFKFYGAYTLDYNEQLGFGSGNSTEFSAFTTAQSGTPVTTRFNLYGYDNTILNGRGDLGRTSAYTQTDFAIRHKIRFGDSERYSFVFDLDILNLFNENNELLRFENITPTTTGFTVEDLGLTDDSIVGQRIFQTQPTNQQFIDLIDAEHLRDPRYNLPNIFQAGRTVRFGFRFLF